MTKGRDRWESPVTALVVTVRGVSAESISRLLSLDGPDVPSSTRVCSTADWWALAVEESYSPDVDEQIRELVRVVAPRMADLAACGQAVHVDISGTVGSDDRLTVSPASLALLKTLEVPVTFTALADPAHPPDDSLAWLDTL